MHVPAPESATAVIVCEQLVTLTLSFGSRVKMVLKISAQYGEPDMRPRSRDALKVSNLVLHAQIKRHPLNGLDPLDLGVVQQRPPNRQVEKTLHIIQGDRHLPNRQVERGYLLVPALHKCPLHADADGGVPHHAEPAEP